MELKDLPGYEGLREVRQRWQKVEPCFTHRKGSGYHSAVGRINNSIEALFDYLDVELIDEQNKVKKLVEAAAPDLMAAVAKVLCLRSDDVGLELTEELSRAWNKAKGDD